MNPDWTGEGVELWQGGHIDISGGRCIMRECWHAFYTHTVHRSDFCERASPILSEWWAYYIGDAMTKKGYKQTAQHIANRKAAQKKDRLGDAVSVQGGRTRALRYFPAEPCEKCGKEKVDRHHKDGNTANNARDNIRFLCRRCHMLTDGRLENFRQMAIAGIPKLLAAKAASFVDTKYRTGDRCPECGRKLMTVAVRKSGIVYMGCRKERKGCGFNAGSYRRKDN